MIDGSVLTVGLLDGETEGSSVEKIQPQEDVGSFVGDFEGDVEGRLDKDGVEEGGSDGAEVGLDVAPGTQVLVPLLLLQTKPGSQSTSLLQSDPCN
jgi:hypothetical protein